ncbi:3' terminal RNA ribose 2'-O-methyltransferase Hen1 [Lapillicoccus jejuensis]|uniref:Small RNA 2'-O-methyltransferase n=1 Tax=Lapillicoccus jejuensis TaxID=402171 RepID=A0A542DYY0_9MICO|nr:3' terminal RNA ribose 2'-O-methyltransferase Hen1 [Lapillicoccus jejuensis]TQJ08303.1 3' terminal RNA ribose 2'-O-methyltransferase Hen1 [Lapillicoccus jejuensis]
MLLTLTATASPGLPDASDLGYLLHKHPERVQQLDSSVGLAHVLYPEVSRERCTVLLLLEVDPVGLVRGTRFAVDGFALGQYVNDRPYAASSLLAVALGRVFRTAVAGRCAARPELVDVPLDLEVHVPALPARVGSGTAGGAGGADLVRRLFGPLGWEVEAREVPLDDEHPEWGGSPYVDLRLHGTHRLADALGHLVVLLPVLDGSKHYWVSSDEVDKLVRTGGGWLATHPDRDLVMHRYLARQRSLVREATARLDALDDTPEPDVVDADADADARGPEAPLAVQRRDAVAATLRRLGARSVVDLGCGEGALLSVLLDDPAVTRVVGVDASVTVLQRAATRLRLDRMPDRRRERLELRQSSATYRDPALAGADAVVLMEVVEHVDPERLPELARSVLAHARPAHVVLTTPNAEYNVLYPALPAGAVRHPDHRFEWTRAELAAFLEDVGATYGYAVEVTGVGPQDATYGAPTQLAVLTRLDVPPDQEVSA